MHEWKLADNLVRLRHENKIKQEELAAFVGVTKASVSKWENGLSTPDILLLPQLAAFFDVSIDELIGYESQLTSGQIRQIYRELCECFARLPFQEALERTRSFVHRYYSCYPFLLQICVLYINHFMLAGDDQKAREILEEADLICGRILENCGDVGVCADTASLRAMVQLQLGNPARTVAILEELASPERFLGENDGLLAHAYEMLGENEKARDYVQIRMYLQLLGLIAMGIHELAVNADDRERSHETIRRILGVMELYHMKQLHPNLTAQFSYQAAVFYVTAEEEEQALNMLEQFVDCACCMLEDQEFGLRGDAYFDRLDVWIDRLPLGAQPPRKICFVRANTEEALRQPVFSGLQENARFQRICCRISEGGKKHE